MSADADTILVLGGGGFIGGHTVAYLRDAGHAIRVIDVYRPDNARADVDWRTGSQYDRDLLKDALEGVGAVVDLSAGGRPGMSVSSLSGEIAHGLGAAVETAEIARAAGVKRYIFPSSGGTVYGLSRAPRLTEDAHCQPINAYGAGKLAAEHYLRLLGTPDFKVTALRVANPFGEGQRGDGQGFIGALFNRARRGIPLEIWGTGDTVRDYVYVRDVAEAIAATLVYDGPDSLFNVGSGVGRSLNEVMEVIREETGVEAERVYQSQRKVDIDSNILDIALARRELKWEPRTDFREAIRRTAQWWAALPA